MFILCLFENPQENTLPSLTPQLPKALRSLALRVGRLTWESPFNLFYFWTWSSSQWGTWNYLFSRKVVKDLMKIKLTILQSSPVFHRPGWWEDPWKASDFQKSDSNPSGIRKKSTWDEKKKSIWDEKKIHLGCPLTLRTLPAAMETSFLMDRCWKYRITVFWTQCVLPCYPNTLCVWPVCCRVTCIQWNHSLAHCLP